MSPYCDLELENSKSIFLHSSGPWWCTTIPSLVTKGSVVEEISLRWTFAGILNLSCDLDLDHNRAIQSFHKTIQLMMMMCHQTKFSRKRISSSEDMLESHVLIIWSFTGTVATSSSAFRFRVLILLSVIQRVFWTSGARNVKCTRQLQTHLWPLLWNAPSAGYDARIFRQGLRTYRFCSDRSMKPTRPALVMTSVPTLLLLSFSLNNSLSMQKLRL